MTMIDSIWWVALSLLLAAVLAMAAAFLRLGRAYADFEQSVRSLSNRQRRVEQDIIEANRQLVKLRTVIRDAQFDLVQEIIRKHGGV